MIRCSSIHRSAACATGLPHRHPAHLMRLQGGHGPQDGKPFRPHAWGAIAPLHSRCLIGARHRLTCMASGDDGDDSPAHSARSDKDNERPSEKLEASAAGKDDSSPEGGDTKTPPTPGSEKGSPPIPLSPSDPPTPSKLLLSDLYKPTKPNPLAVNMRELRALLGLLVNYGGTFGTAAVAIGFLTKVDPFGSFHWSAADLELGLLFFVPTLLLDAVFMIPDYATKPEEATDTMRLFLKPELLTRLQDAQTKITAEEAADEEAETAAAATAAAAAAAAASEATATAGVESGVLPAPLSAEASISEPDAAAARFPLSGPEIVPGSAGTPPAVSSSQSEQQQLQQEAADSTAQQQAARAGADVAEEAQADKNVVMNQGGQMYVSVGAIAGGKELSPGEATTRKTRFALEMLQEYYTRNNPAANMNPATELFVILVSCLADEMLYRAVSLTLVSLWLRDRLYEGGADDIITLAGGAWHGDALQAGQWGALGLGFTGGVLAFALRAFREAALVEKAEEIANEAAEEQKKKRKPRALPGWEKPEPVKKPGDKVVRRLPAELVTEVAVQLTSSMGSLNSVTWRLEGFRELLQVTASGVTFIMTGNLAASFAGSVVAQSMFSIYQRNSLQRAIKRMEDQQQRIVKIIEGKAK